MFSVLLLLFPFAPSTQAQVKPYPMTAPPDIGAMQVVDLVNYSNAVDLSNFLASLVVTPTQSTSPSDAGSAPMQTGDCYGGPIPDAIVNRESEGQSDVVNGDTGAFGCFQIMPQWWAGQCAGLSRDTDGQKACAQIILDEQGPSAWG